MLPRLKTEGYNILARNRPVYALKPMGWLKGPIRTFLDIYNYTNLTETGKARFLR